MLKQADIVVTNPPFSIFRGYVALLVKHRKKFLIIGTQIRSPTRDFSAHQDNRLWLGCTNFNVGMFFSVPDDWERFSPH
ncbi:MAG: modification methylase EcoRI [Rhodoferax sp.]|nr:modification methylase EcoRI [Rhodoferax sp.]